MTNPPRGPLSPAERLGIERKEFSSLMCANIAKNLDDSLIAALADLNAAEAREHSLKLEVLRLTRIVSKELTENDDLGSEFVYVNALKEQLSESQARVAQLEGAWSNANSKLLEGVPYGAYRGLILNAARDIMFDALSSNPSTALEAVRKGQGALHELGLYIASEEYQVIVDALDALNEAFGKQGA